MDYTEFLFKGFVSPNDVGVTGNNDSESIQNAVDIALKCGINKVVVPKYNSRTNDFVWEISKAIILNSNITIVLDDCHLRMAEGVYDNFFYTANLFTKTGAVCDEELENITIKGIGKAVLDGGKPNGLNEYTHLKDGRPSVIKNSPIVFFNVRYFSVENISIIDQRYWGMRFEYCKFGKIKDIFICSVRDRNNQDGINLRNGCNNIVIENVYAQTGDDTIAITAIDMKDDSIYNIVDENQNPDVHSVTIRNVRGAALMHPLVTIRNHHGIKVHDVLIENIYDTEPISAQTVTVNVMRGEDVTSTYIEDVGLTDHVEECDYSKLPRYAMIHIGDKAYYQNGRHSVMGETYNITVNNVVCRYSEILLALGCELKNLKITNLTASGECKRVITTCPEGINGGPQLKLLNALVDTVNFKAEAEAETAAIHFGDLYDGEYVKRVTVKNVLTENVKNMAVLNSDCDIKFGDFKNIDLKSEAILLK